MLIDLEGVRFVIHRCPQRLMHGRKVSAQDVDDRTMDLGNNTDRLAIIERFLWMSHCMNVRRDVLWASLATEHEPRSEDRYCHRLVQADAYGFPCDMLWRRSTDRYARMSTIS
jgi:hypothetical protein